MMQAPHDILGVPPDANRETVRKAYHALLRRYNAGREPEKLKEIRAAYEELRAQTAFLAQFREAKARSDETPPRPVDPATPQPTPRPGPERAAPEPNTLVPPAATPRSPTQCTSESGGHNSAWAGFDLDAFKHRILRRDFRGCLAELRRAIEADRMLVDRGLRRGFALFASVTVWAAPSSFDKLSREFGDVVHDLQRNDPGSAIMYRRALAAQWREYCDEIQPVASLVDFMELLPLASGATSLALAERLATSAERDPVGTSRSIDGLFADEGYASSSILGYFGEALELLHQELEDLGMADAPPETALVVVETDAPPAQRDKVSNLLGLTTLDNLRWPTYAVLAASSGFIIGWPMSLLVAGVVALGFIPKLKRFTPAAAIERRWDRQLDETAWGSQLTYAELATQLGYMKGLAAKRCKAWVDEESVDPTWDHYYRVLRLVKRHQEQRMFGETS
ncbi:MAG: hypothetical protein V3V08_10630 [Nannocystaceae bacterium]